MSADGDAPFEINRFARSEPPLDGRVPGRPDDQGRIERPERIEVALESEIEQPLLIGRTCDVRPKLLRDGRTTDRRSGGTIYDASGESLRCWPCQNVLTGTRRQKNPIWSFFDLTGNRISVLVLTSQLRTRPRGRYPKEAKQR